MDLMKKYNDAIRSFHEANRLAAEASYTFSQIFRAKAEDLSRIDELHTLFDKVSSENGFRADGRNNDKQFVFAVLHLYSPASLCGGGINKRLRRAIAAALGVRADTAVYKMRSTAVSWYDTYPLFHSECNVAVRALSEHLGIVDELN